MAKLGVDIITVGKSRIGQPYVLGANVPLDNPNWKGPWDCAEYASWCVFQAYGMLFGVGNTSSVDKAEPFSGFWFDDAQQPGVGIGWKKALKIPGALIVRRPRKKLIGHVTISLGDGKRTLEARSKKMGLGIFGNADTRPWDIGVLLPGVDYSGVEEGDDPLPSDPEDGEPIPQAELPPGFLDLRRPNRKGPEIVALQRKLAAADIDPGPIDGEFGPMTGAAVISFQTREGLEVDGIVGPVTAQELGLAFPIVPSASDKALWAELTDTTPPPPIDITPPAGSSVAGADPVVGIELKSKIFRAKTAGGFSFMIGSRVTFTDDMHRVGLFQTGVALSEIDQFGVYRAADFKAAFKQWAHFVEPTLTAEGGGKFARINSYDRAAFTFGAPQLAAHTPDKNFIIYLRALLALPNAATHFPELSLRANGAGQKTVHLQKGAAFTDLEAPVMVTRPNGVKETQLKKLMTYLNSSATDVDDAELMASARLMNWLRLDPMARQLQISIFIDTAKANLARAKVKMPAFDGTDWRIALWIMDILHHGRGTFVQMKAALASGNPEAKLSRLGLSATSSRFKEISAGIERLDDSGVMAGFKV